MVLLLWPLIALAALLVTLVLYALLRSMNAFTVVLVNAFVHPHGNWLTKAVLWPLGKLASGVLIVTNAVEHSLSVAVSHGLIPVADWIKAHATRQRLIQAAVIALTGDIAYGFEHGFGIRVPREIRQKVGLIPKWAGATAASGLIALHEWLKRLSKGIDTLQRETHSALRAIHRTLEQTIPREFAHVRARERALARELGGVRREAGNAWRIARKLAWVTRYAGAVALVAAALAKLGLSWVRCRNVGRVGRQVCGLDAGLLESLLGDAVVILSAISVVEFAKELQTLEGEAIAIMRAGIKEL